MINFIPRTKNQLKMKDPNFFKSLILAVIILLITSISNAQTCSINAGIQFQMCEDEGTEWQLFGSASDPLSQNVSISWSVVQEPDGSEVVINEPNALTTSVSNVSIPGDYIFQIKGICPDGSGSPTDFITYTLNEVIPNPGLPERLQFCEEGDICIDNPDPSIQYGWVPLNFSGGTRFNFNDECINMRVTGLNPGDDAKVVLISKRGACERRDTVEVMVMNYVAALAGDDAYICGESFCKLGVASSMKGPGEFQIAPVGVIQTWTQLTGPSDATISNGKDVCFTDLENGTYTFELQFEYGEPCNKPTDIDTFTLYVSSGLDEGCQDLSTNIHYIADCTGTLDQWIIDLKDYGFNPNLHPLDNIEWLWVDQQGECPAYTVPNDRESIAVIPTEGICDGCALQAIYSCHLSPGCVVVLQFQFAVAQINCEPKTDYYCTTNGDPYLVSNFAPELCRDGCFTSTGAVLEVVNSTALPTGTIINLVTDVHFPIGIHQFNIHQFIVNRYDVFADCIFTLPYIVNVQGAPTASNAGTDIILPCSQNFATLSGNNPNVPNENGLVGQWVFVSGPSNPTMSNINSTEVMVSDLGIGNYIFAWEIGNAACGFIRDEVSVVVAVEPPSGLDLGPAQITCYGQDITICAFNSPDFGLSSWEISPDENITLSNANGECIVISGMEETTAYTIKYLVTNGCGKDSVETIITTNDIQGSNSNAGPDFCDELSNQSDPNIMALDASALLPNTTGTWNIVDFSPSHLDVFIYDINDPKTNIRLNNLETGLSKTVCLEWLVESEECLDQRDTMCINYRSKIGWSTSMNVDFCANGGVFTFDPDLDQGFRYQESYLWDIENYNGPAGVQFLSERGDSALTVDIPSAGVYQFYMYDGLAVGCRDPLTVTFYVTAPSSPANAGDDVVLCDEYSYTMDGNTTENGGFWTIVPVEGQTSIPTNDNFYPDIEDLSDPKTTVHFPRAGDYLAVWTVYADTTINASCFEIDSMNITIIGATIADEDQSFCTLSEVKLQGSKPTSQGQASWRFVDGPSIPTLILSSNSGQTALYDGFSVEGIYIFEYSIESEFCGVGTDTTYVHFLSPSPDAGPDIIACEESISIVGSEIESGYSSAWSILSGIGSLEGDLNSNVISIIELIQGDTVFVEYAWLSEDGCLGADTIQIIADYFNQVNGFAFDPSSCDANDGEILLSNVGIERTYVLNFIKDGINMGPTEITTDNSGIYSLNMLGAGVYTELTLTTANDCVSNPLSFELGDNCPTDCEGFSISCKIDKQLQCAGDTDAIISVSTEGNQGMITYQWSTGDNTPMVENVASGIYEVTVTDDVTDDCFLICEVIVEEPTIISTELEYDICEGAIITINNENYNASGSYEQLIETADGCDSVLLITINVNQGFSEDQNYTIFSGDTVVVNGVDYTLGGVYTQNLTSNNGCDSLINVFIEEVQSIVYFDLDECWAKISSDNFVYTEFTPEYPSVLPCAIVESSHIYRENPMTNVHSCTPGLEGTNAMCVGSLDACEYDKNSDKPVVFEMVITPNEGDRVSLHSLEFYQKSPENFEWILGADGPNNYPTKYGVRVLLDDQEVFFMDDLSASNEWTKETILLDGILVSQTSIVRVEMMGYCLIGIDSPVSAWDLENVNVFASCVQEDETKGIKGVISTPYEEFINQVKMTLEGPEGPSIKASNEFGKFGFVNQPNGFEYVLTPYKNDDPLNGVSTKDILLIQRHILGLDDFFEASQFIAADVNNNQKIAASDISELRKLILSIYDDFPNNTSWRFYNEEVILNINNPWYFDEFKLIPKEENSDDDINFKGIKIGDLDGSVISNRSNDNIRFTYKIAEDQETLQKKVTLYAKDFVDVFGLQMGIELNGATVLNIQSDRLSIEPHHYRIVDGKLLLSWNTIESISVTDDAALFTINLKQSDETQSVFELISGFNHEVYQGIELETLNIELESMSNVKENIEMQLSPNPFSEDMMIRFKLIEDQQIHIDIFDIDGQFITSKTKYVEKGVQYHLLKGNLFNHTGTYIIRLTTKQGIVTDRIIHIK